MLPNSSFMGCRLKAVLGSTAFLLSFTLAFALTLEADTPQIL